MDKPSGNPSSGRARRKQAEAQARQRRMQIMIGGPIAVLLIVGLFVGLDRYQTNQDRNATATAVAALPAVVPAAWLPEASIPRDGRTIGKADAPIKVVEWADFQ